MRGMPVRLDEIDRQILDLLQSDGRMTNASIARFVGLSAPSVLQRIRRLEDSGIIKEYKAVLGQGQLGYDLMVLVHVSLALHQEPPIQSFAEEASALPEVLECLHVSGDFDFQLKVVARSMPEYQAFITHKLSRIAGVGKIMSSFVLAPCKVTTDLPLP